jgi:hypothetical protein
VRRIVAAFFVALAATAGITSPGVAAATGVSACARQPRDAVAQMRGELDGKRHGLFATFIGAMTEPAPSETPEAGVSHASTRQHC